MSVVILSTVTFVLSTMPELTPDLDLILFDNQTSEEGLPVDRWETVSAV